MIYLAKPCPPSRWPRLNAKPSNSSTPAWPRPWPKAAGTATATAWTRPPPPKPGAPWPPKVSSCTGRHCPAFQSCSYYERRKELVAAQVIVVNHDLLLSSLGARLLPELDNCLLVLDEAPPPARHRPGAICQQYGFIPPASGWTSSPPGLAHWPAARSRRNCRHPAAQQRLAPSHGAAGPGRHGAVRRNPEKPRGALSARPVPARTPGRAARSAPAAAGGRLAHSTGLLDVFARHCQGPAQHHQRNPGRSPRLAALYAQLGSLAPRLEAVFATTELLLHAPPPAKPLPPNGSPWKWMANGLLCKPTPARSCPAARWPAFWSQVRGGVLTSATLTSCGSFDFFLREVGLHDLPTLATLEVASPFDYPSQGVLWAHHTQADPKHAGPFTQEMVHTCCTTWPACRPGPWCYSHRKSKCARLWMPCPVPCAPKFWCKTPSAVCAAQQAPRAG